MTDLLSEDFTAYNNLPIIFQINQLKEEVDLLRPWPDDLEQKILQKFRLDWNYNSNAIEGNSLNYGETTAFLMHGITAKGKPLRDYLDIRGHNEAIDYLSKIVKQIEDFGETDIRGLHSILLVESYENPYKTGDGTILKRKIHLGEYKKMPNHVQTITGETHFYASPEDTPFLMRELVEWLRASLADSHLHPLIVASVFHHSFTSIHPFDDGNGRMSRLLTNLILMHYGFPPIVIKYEERNTYYLSLSQADSGDIEPFIIFLGSNLNHALNIYIKGARGENIDEPTDLKKKLALFKKEVEASQDKVEAKRSGDILNSLYKESIISLFSEIQVKLIDFKEFFFNYNENVIEYNSKTNFYEYKTASLVVALEHQFLHFTDLLTNRIYNIQLSDFKVKGNSFTIDILFYVSLKELTYSINFVIIEGSAISRARNLYRWQWLNRSKKLEKKYHQDISQEEIKNLAEYVGESALKTMTELFAREKQNANSFELEIRSLWNEVIQNIRDLTVEFREQMRIKSAISVSENLITVTLPTEFDAFLNTQQRQSLGTKLYLLLQQKLQLDKIPFVDIQTEPPF